VRTPHAQSFLIEIDGHPGNRRFSPGKKPMEIPARSREELIAKAKALKAVSIAEDIDRQAAIAGSLAGDVLRYFNGAA
jgi:hypothetical protein